MFTKQTVKDVDLKGKTVFLRADYNVPVEDGKIMDDYRIQQSLPTVNYLLEQDAKLIIASHLGRPDGKPDPAASMAPVAKRLSKLIGRPVEFVDECVGDKVSKAASELKNGQVLMLENLRFHAEEKTDDDAFARQLAGLAEVYVNDAFAVDHRKDASVVAITNHLPSVAGFLLEREMETLTRVMESPKKPVVAIVGGAKIADKLDVLNRFIELADMVAVGGAMANTFLAATGVDVGDSLYDKEDLHTAKDILKRAEAEAQRRPFVFSIPHDVVVAEKIDKTAPTRIVELTTHTMADIQHYPKRVPESASKVHKHEKILDIGPFSASLIAGAIQLAETVIWNGTMGITETPGLQGPIGPTAHGTQTVVEALLGELGHKPFTVVGGGDTVGYVQSRNLTEAFGHVSTGGGASLEVLAGHKLPGVEALLDKK
ncbi:MAG TPA: phosphoglycerate kinase [Candidatus Saccharimonadia bacterium]|nr:phosphoglycerate kinase [Candidatus Saccharimonadia bacterium]